jgi:signal transduction histidine kinase
MTAAATPDFGELIAQGLRDNHLKIAKQWLERLGELLPVDSNDIFPSDSVLDHIPMLIKELADSVSGTSGAVVANTVVLSKARELGELRFGQGASVHQLLREYRILSAVISAFVHEQIAAMPVASNSAEAITVLGRLNDAVLVLMQTTVDTFVGRYTEQIEDQTTRLESFNRMVGHELRQPLSGVAYAVALLRSPEAEDRDSRGKLVDVADRNVKRLTQLLGMLGALIRIDHDNPTMQEFDVAKIVDDVLRQLTEAGEAKAVDLRSRVPSTMMTADVSRLELVLVNLIANGIKYRDPAKTDAFVEVSFSEAAERCTLEVRDNGLGISEKDRPKLFRRFYRAHAERDRELHNDGIGLGLAIAAECAKGLGGTLTYVSTVGEGTTFTLTVPRDPGSAR